MKRIVLFVFLLVYLTACKNDEPDGKITHTHPSHKYTFTDISADELSYLESDYIAVYSDIYDRDGTKRILLTNTISIRNISKIDSAYILSVEYFDSYGVLVKNYSDSTILLSPLESIEFVVKEEEKLGGAGANFIIDWGATVYSDQILIQSIMIGSYGGLGISFLSEAKKVWTNTASSQ